MIRIVTGDITRLDVDAIVNAANERMAAAAASTARSKDVLDAALREASAA